MTETTGKANDPYTLQPDLSQTPTATLTPIAEEVPLDDANEPSMTWMLLRELVETVVLSLIIFLLIRQVLQNYRIESHSMQPNFYEGQFILVNKLAYKIGQPARGEVIVFHNPNNTSEDYIKRVIGLPGDTIEIRDEKVYINNQELPEPFAKEPYRTNAAYGPKVVEANHIFVMGDNRGNSQDSRYIGAIDENLIVGKAWLRLWPLPVFGLIHQYHLEPGASTTMLPVALACCQDKANHYVHPTYAIQP
ncbi:MAG: signal peptidase I [Caldilineaceae bacterium]